MNDLARPSLEVLIAESQRDIDRFLDELAAGCLVPLAGVEAVVAEKS